MMGLKSKKGTDSGAGLRARRDDYKIRSAGERPPKKIKIVYGTATVADDTTAPSLPIRFIVNLPELSTTPKTT
jgi:hypothetical protein